MCLYRTFLCSVMCCEMKSDGPPTSFCSVGRPKHVRVMAGALEGDIFIGPKAEVIPTAQANRGSSLVPTWTVSQQRDIAMSKRSDFFLKSPLQFSYPRPHPFLSPRSSFWFWKENPNL